VAPAKLSPREREVAQLLARGLSNKAIAGRLYLSERTIDNHVHHILDKLGFGSRVQVATWLAKNEHLS
jgi:non-specific serine/threonine protein kinase